MVAQSKQRSWSAAATKPKEPQTFWWLTPHATKAAATVTASSNVDVHRSVQEGVPFSAFEAFLTLSALPRSEVLAIADLSSRTLHRRKAAGRLTPIESDRLWRVTNLYRLAVELFDGSYAEASEWLSSPCRGLGGASPLTYAQTEAGAREVEQLIGRLEHGVVS